MSGMSGWTRHRSRQRGKGDERAPRWHGEDAAGNRSGNSLVARSSFCHILPNGAGGNFSGIRHRQLQKLAETMPPSAYRARSAVRQGRQHASPGPPPRARRRVS